MRKTALLLALSVFSGDLFAQSAPAMPPIQVAQAAPAGGPSSGVGAPPVAVGASSNLVAFIAIGVAGIAAAGTYSATASNH